MMIKPLIHSILILGCFQFAQPTDASIEGGLASANPPNNFAVDTSVIGRAIPHSESITTECNRINNVEKIGKYSQCRIVFSDVVKMMQEPREIEWAKSMEAELRDCVKRYAPEETTIRHLECRQSICILEVASPNGEFRPDAPSAAFSRISNEAHLFVATSLTAKEEGHNGEVITVTFRPFKRLGSKEQE